MYSVNWKHGIHFTNDHPLSQTFSKRQQGQSTSLVAVKFLHPKLGKRLFLNKLHHELFNMRVHTRDLAILK